MLTGQALSLLETHLTRTAFQPFIHRSLADRINPPRLRLIFNYDEDDHILGPLPCALRGTTLVMPKKPVNLAVPHSYPRKQSQTSAIHPGLSKQGPVMAGRKNIDMLLLSYWVPGFTGSVLGCFSCAASFGCAIVDCTLSPHVRSPITKLSLSIHDACFSFCDLV